MGQIIRKAAFSLIELLAVIAIIGIISAVAIPSYKKYVMQTNFMVGVNMLQECRQQVDIAYQETGNYPLAVCGTSTNSSTTLNDTNINAITYNNSITAGTNTAAVITVTFQTSVVPGGGNASSIHIGATFSPTQKKLIWSCGSWDTTVGYMSSYYLTYLPSTCAKASVLTELTNVN